MKCTFDTSSSIAVVTVTGELNLAATPDLRAAVLKCLASGPSAVLVDAAGLTLTDDILLTALAAAARRAAAWPSVPVILCSPPRSEAAEAARRLRIDQQVIICSGLAEGRRHAARRILPPRISDSYLPLPESVREARHLVVDACRVWELPIATSSAELIAAELVTNAVEHAGTRIGLVVSRTSRNLHVAVRDHSSVPTRLIRLSHQGRGLVLVDELATHWGCTPTVDGKVIWATLRVR